MLKGKTWTEKSHAYENLRPDPRIVVLRRRWEIRVMGVWNFKFAASFLHTMMTFPPAAPVFSNVGQWKVGPEKTDCRLVLSRSVVKIKETVYWAHRGRYLACIRCWMALSSLPAVPGSSWLETMCCSAVSSYFLNTQDTFEQRELIDLTNRLTSWMVNEQMNLDVFQPG